MKSEEVFEENYLSGRNVQNKHVDIKHLQGKQLRPGDVIGFKTVEEEDQVRKRQDHTIKITDFCFSIRGGADVNEYISFVYEVNGEQKEKKEKVDLDDFEDFLRNVIRENKGVMER